MTARLLHAVPAASSVPEYLRYMSLKGFSADTITGRRQFFARLERQLGFPADLATERDLLEWRVALTAGERSVARYVSHLRVYYAWAIEQGQRADNPAVRIPVPRSGRLLPRPVADEDLAAALASAPPRIRLWLILAAWCGLRAKEIALLRRECILDTAPRPVIVIAAGATKGRSERAIPLSRFVIRELRAARLPASGWAFPRGDGQPGPNRPSRVSQLAGNYLRRAGIPATLHQFRHWFGTGTWRASRDLRLVQELMGHQSPVTTAGYAAWDRAEAAAAVEALPEPADLT